MKVNEIKCFIKNYPDVAICFLAPFILGGVLLILYNVHNELYKREYKSNIKYGIEQKISIMKIDANEEYKDVLAEALSDYKIVFYDVNRKDYILVRKDTQDIKIEVGVKAIDVKQGEVK